MLVGGVLSLKLTNFFVAGMGITVTPNVSTGNGMDFLIGRVSYTFGLTGPCISTHTACSSSLISTHLAHNGLMKNECEAAVSAGIFLILLSGTMAGICQLQVPLMPTLFPVEFSFSGKFYPNMLLCTYPTSNIVQFQTVYG